MDATVNSDDESKAESISFFFGRHAGSQKKQSENYQVQLFLIEDEKAFVLKNGKQTIVEGGNVLAVGN